MSCNYARTVGSLSDATFAVEDGIGGSLFANESLWEVVRNWYASFRLLVERIDFMTAVRLNLKRRRAEFDTGRSGLHEAGDMVGKRHFGADASELELDLLEP